MSTDWRCQTCRLYVKLPGEIECGECARYRRYGTIIEALTIEVDELPLARVTLDALDALADLMHERRVLIAAHRREIFEEQREAQRAARDGYDDGRSDAQRQADGGW